MRSNIRVKSMIEFCQNFSEFRKHQVSARFSKLRRALALKFAILHAGVVFDYCINHSRFWLLPHYCMLIGARGLQIIFSVSPRFMLIGARGLQTILFDISSRFHAHWSLGVFLTISSRFSCSLEPGCLFDHFLTFSCSSVLEDFFIIFSVTVFFHLLHSRVLLTRG